MNESASSTSETPKKAGRIRIEGLNGMRAVAVVSVLAYHIWPTVFPGGYLGVDVFFVISGFLITTLLLREKDSSGRIDLLAFWKRRARRLLPALALVVVASIAGARLANEELLVGIQRQVIGALTFSTNWVEIWAGSDYFADANHALFQTLWSLAVEEQFYLFWPVILLGLVSFMKSTWARFAFAAVAAVVSSSLMAYLYDPQSSTRVYYGTDTHSFGLMIGVALAFAFAGAGSVFESEAWLKIRSFIGFTAVLALLVMFVVLDSAYPFAYRGGILIASLITAAAVATLPGKIGLFTRFCQLPVLDWIGERSYGIYLWHWPVLLILKSFPAASAEGYLQYVGLPVAAVAITFLLSEASYRWIESPVRSVGYRGTWAMIRSSIESRGRQFYLRFVPATVLGLTICAVSVFGFLTAPSKSQVQLAVEFGERAIADQTSNQNGTMPTNDGVIASTETAGSQPDAAWPREMKIPPGDRIVGLGDSVMSGTAPAIYARFPGIRINARPILQWREAPGMIRQMIDDGTMRDVVILNFGTNAGFKEPESEIACRQVLDMLGPKRRVVLVNTVGISYWVPSANETLSKISSEYPNTIVADWNAIIRERPGLLFRDKTHPNEEGSVVYADLLADTLAKLGAGQ